MRTTQTMTVSLPPQIMQNLEAYRQKHDFTRSELVRHALRELFYKQTPVYKPTKSELRAIKEGREEIKKGNFVTWEEMRGKLGSKNGSKSKKSSGMAAG